MPPSRNSTGKPAPEGPGEASAVPEDLDLLRQSERGDRVAFEALVDRHARYLYGIAHALAGAGDAEDLVQETFLAALESRFRGESSVRTWLVRILVNRAGMLKRSGWFRRRSAMPEVPPAGERSPDARLDLATMLAALSTEHRAVIVLRELEQMSYAEIAEALGLPIGTVESRLHRAREELRRKFKDYTP